MKLSIITINYNNASGLEKTMNSILNQTFSDFEYIIVDGGSTDTSCQVINDQLGDGIRRSVVNSGRVLSVVEFHGIKVKWISEKDSGIYNAMNKGIRMATGKYIQFLNSSDYLIDKNVVATIVKELSVNNSKSEVEILYGNMLKEVLGKVISDKGFAGRQPTLLDFYSGTLNHSPVYIKRSLFDDFGLYDETLKYVSDWKWYVQVIILGGVKLLYVDIDIIHFDMTGISTTNWDKTQQEKKYEIGKLLPEAILKDYDDWAFGIEQLKRLKRHPMANKLMWVMERMLFKMEKQKNKRRNSSSQL